MSSKKSLLVFHSWRKSLKSLGPKQAGMVLINLLDVDAGEDPSYDLSAYPKAEGVFAVLNDFADEKRAHYEAVSEKRREAVSKRYQDSTNATNVASATNADDRIGKDRKGKDRISKDSLVKAKNNNKFINFDQRDYSEEEMKALEEKLL